MGLHDPAGYRQAQADAAGVTVAGLLATEEAVEHAWLVFGGDTFAGVFNRHLDVAVLALHADANLAARRGVAHGVLDEIRDDALHARSVERERREIVAAGHAQSDALLLGPYSETVDRIGH